jgi:hypothetical protein
MLFYPSPRDSRFLEETIPKAIAGLAWRVPLVRKWARDKEREDQRKRMAEALRRFGVEKDGVTTLTITPEILKFLSGTSEKP